MIDLYGKLWVGVNRETEVREARTRDHNIGIGCSRENRRGSYL